VSTVPEVSTVFIPQVSTVILPTTIEDTITHVIDSTIFHTIEDMETITDFQTATPIIDIPPFVITTTFTITTRKFLAVPNPSCACPPPPTLTITKTILNNNHNLIANQMSSPTVVPSCVTCSTSNVVSCETRAVAALLIVPICHEGARKCHGSNMVCVCVNGQWDTPKLLAHHPHETCVPLGEFDVDFVPKNQDDECKQVMQ